MTKCMTILYLFKFLIEKVTSILQSTLVMIYRLTSRDLMEVSLISEVRL